MITIQSAMFLALGFLTAGLVVLLIAPFYRRRAERLAIDEVKRNLPMSEAEIRADKDRLRAEYAIRIHQLESRVDEAAHQAARQRIELNRRDGTISGLEGDIGTLRTSLEEHENARRVLEQTITDRLPKVEQRLAQAREQLQLRDHEIERLSRSSDLTARALEETKQINTQQRDELLRTSAALVSRSARNRDQLADPRFDGEVALRSEIEALRARSREQSELITRLQGLLVRGGKTADVRVNGEAPSDGEDQGFEAVQEREIARLRASLAEAEASLKAAQSTAEAGKAGQVKVDDALRQFKLKNDELAGEVARLKASLAIYESAQRDDTAIKDSKVAMKARLGALEADVETQAATIQSLCAELAAANERLARQAAHYRDELKRLGAGTLPVSAEVKKSRDASPQRASLAERMGTPRAVPLRPVAAREVDEARSASYLKALSGRDAATAGAPDAVADVKGQAPAEPGDGTVTIAAEAKPPRKTGLLDRISSVGKSSS